MRDDFNFTGSNQATKELVKTVNQLVKLINGMTFDMGQNGGTDVVKVTQGPNGLKIDMTQVAIPPFPTP